MFVDASAIVAILAKEADSDDLRLRLKSTKKRIISAVAVFEACLAMRRLRDVSASEAYAIVAAFLKIYAIKQIAVEPRFAEIAIESFEIYGKGQGHRAGLNMGDCFAYACAKAHKVPLLCKGDDFVHTDIALA
jgi:ribonuclease VapC